MKGGVRSCVLSQLSSLTIIGGLPRRVKRQSETAHSMVFLAYSRHSDSRTRRSDCGELVKTYPGKTTGKKEERLGLLIFCPRLRTRSVDHIDIDCSVMKCFLHDISLRYYFTTLNEHIR